MQLGKNKCTPAGVRGTEQGTAAVLVLLCKRICSGSNSFHQVTVASADGMSNTSTKKISQSDAKATTTQYNTLAIFFDDALWEEAAHYACAVQNGSGG